MPLLAKTADAPTASWVNILSAHLNQQVFAVKEKKLQSLWAGYGHVSRLQVSFKNSKSDVQLILKDVHPVRASGVGHDRKIKSYAVEAYFYQHAAPALCDSTALGLPRPVYIVSNPPEGFTFVLSDISVDYPRPAPSSFNSTQVKAALDWLATFHAHFWEQPLPQVPAWQGRDACPSDLQASGSPPTAQFLGLWQQGTYWFFDTRQEEFEQIGSQWSDLKSAAAKVDQRLKGMDAAGHFSNSYRTVLHGDFKNENIHFDKAGTKCAAYDFQYCGGGYGVQDVVYLFCSSVDSSVLNQKEGEYLQYYHERLLKALSAKSSSAQYPMQKLQEHFELALLDYTRFMAGWGFWGSGVSWCKSRAKSILGRIGSSL